MSSPNEEAFLTQIQTVFEDQVRRRRRLLTVLFVLLGMLCGITFFIDDAVMHWIAEHRTKPIRKLGGIISNYGDWPWLMAAALPFLIFAWWKKRPRMFRIVLAMIIASSLAGIANNAVRGTTGRTRPNANFDAGWYGLRNQGKWLIGVPKFNSFPSGHAAAAFGYFSVLAVQKRRRAWLWLLPAFLIGASRMAIDAHHLSDVCFAAWIGLGAAWWVGSWIWLKRWADRVTAQRPR